MEPHRRPDETRRRVIAGLGAIGIGAVGIQAVRALSSGPAERIVEHGSTEPTAAIAPTVRVPASTATPIVEQTTTTTVVDPTTSVPGASVVVACRDAWRAAPVTGPMVEHTPVRLTVHHTAVSQTSPSQGPSRIRKHQRYHQSLGWPDLAYHYLVDRTGLAYEGRDIRFRGDTGTEYDPTGHFLVCLEGDFDHQEPTDAQLRAAVSLFASASGLYGIDPATLAGHGDYAVTSCPGSSVSAMIPELRTAVAQSGPVLVDLRCGIAGADLIATVERG